MPTLLHLNGPSGVGKSTLARAYAARHPGTLVCDIDELRSWVSGWEDDFVGTGEAVRATALALLTAYLGTGRDVVLPQLIVTPAQAERFEAAAAAAGASYVAVVLDVAPDDAAPPAPWPPADPGHRRRRAHHRGAGRRRPGAGGAVPAARPRPAARVDRGRRDRARATLAGLSDLVAARR